MEDTFISLCATWHLPVAGKLHEIKFVHLVGVGATVIHVDGEVVLHRTSYPGKPGKDNFMVDGVDCLITVEKRVDTLHECKLFCDGASFVEYQRRFQRKFDLWKPVVVGKPFRVVLNKTSSELFADGIVLDYERNFTETGTVTTFLLDSNLMVAGTIVSEGTASKKAVTNTLLVDAEVVPLCMDIDEKEHKLDLGLKSDQKQKKKFE